MLYFSSRFPISATANLPSKYHNPQGFVRSTESLAAETGTLFQVTIHLNLLFLVHCFFIIRYYSSVYYWFHAFTAAIIVFCLLALPFTTKKMKTKWMHSFILQFQQNTTHAMFLHILILCLVDANILYCHVLLTLCITGYYGYYQGN